MTTAGDIVSRINDMGDVDNVLYDVMQFFRGLPGDLDLASASYYLNKEFERNDTGVEYRIEIHTYDAEQVDYDATYADDYEY